MNNGNRLPKHHMGGSRIISRLSLIIIILLTGFILSAIVVRGEGQSDPIDPYLVKDINTATEFF